MTTGTLVYPDAGSLADAAAERMLLLLTELLADRRPVSVCLTGGGVGIAMLEAARRSALLSDVDWSRVHFWWGDERYLPAQHPDRNERQAREALLDGLVSSGRLPEANIHPLPAQGFHSGSDEAAQEAGRELQAALREGVLPGFDLCLLGVGQDGHVASLFPGHASLGIADRAVIAEHASPKPPPERLSLTLPVLNSAKRIWFILAGPDKAAAFRLAVQGSREIPAGRVRGRRETLFLVDEAAAESSGARDGGS